MFTFKHLIGGSLSVLVLAGTAMAQENRALIETPREPVASGPLVTAAASAERVRFVSPGSVVQLRLEAYNEAGQKLFDTELHGGNVLDWHLQDGSGQRLAPGSYACVLTTKTLSGRLSQRVGLVTVNDKQATVEAAGTAQLSQLSMAQQQVIGPVEGNAAFTVLRQGEAETITTATHDGADGQLTRTRGALSFRVGDFFSGKDTEQMRLTEDGKLGLGTDKPQAKLDVAGDVHATDTIRASAGIEFADGTVQTTGLSGRKDKDGNLMPNVAGTGTQNRLAKWTDNSGTLGNSNVTEAASGKLGIGTVNPNYEITLFGNDVGLQLISPGTGVTANDGFRFGIDSTNKAFLWNVEATDMYFGTTATERMRIKATGNVGIGTSNPNYRLDVAGDVNTPSVYRIEGKIVLNSVGTDNFFAGPNAGSTNTGSQNSFFGDKAGAATIGGLSNSFFGASAGAANTFGNANSFFGHNAGAANTSAFNSFFGANAGLSNTEGFSNSFFGNSAGDSNTTGSNNTLIGFGADVASADLGFATAIGAGALVSLSNTVVLGRSEDTVRVPGSFASVGIITTNGNLLVLGTSSFIGAVELTTLGAAGSTEVCRNDSNELSTCSSSLRYKTNIAPFRFGLSLINQLRPIAYNWKDGGMKDVGFGAEDVARINPLFVTYNAAGQVEGVKYDRLSAVFVNAFKEQQAQITKQETQIERQQRQIDELKQIVCVSYPQAGACEEK